MSSDLRIIKSEQAIENAFLELVEEKGFENVHIVDIAKKANVNRNTIYLRYGAKEDIIIKILDKAFDKQIELLDTKSLINTRNSRKAIATMFNNIFNVLSDDIEIYRIILTDNNLSGYLNHILNNVRSMLFTRMIDNRKNRIIVEYILKGVFGIIQNWIINDTGSIEDNVKILTILVCSNLRHIVFK